MFYYVFSVTGEWDDPDYLRFIEDREEAWMYIKFLGLRPRVVAK